jgi:hypothetical protein
LIFCDRDLQLRGAGPYSGSGAAYLLRNFGQTKARKSELPESLILGLCPKVLPHFVRLQPDLDRLFSTPAANLFQFCV